MSNIELSRPLGATLKTIFAVLMAGTVAGCSSDLSRFSYHNAVNDAQLTTASVKKPLATGLAPVGVGSQAYPGDYRAPSVAGSTYPTAPYQRQASVQPYPNQVPQQYPVRTQNYPTQSYPGDARAPLYTASIPSNTAPVSQAPTSVYLPATQVQQPSVSRQALPPAKKSTLAEKIRKALNREPKKSLSNVVQAPTVAPTPVATPTPLGQDRIVTGSVQASAQPKPLVPMKPDPIVTGSIPPKTTTRPGGWSTIGGTRVTISEGETVYNLSRRYGVPAVEILRANNVTDSRNLKVGQSLTIPVYAYSTAAPVSAPDNDILTQSATSHRGSKTLFPAGGAAPIPTPRGGVIVAAKTPVSPTITAPQTNTASAGGYIVASGDTLNRIAYKHGVKVSDLQKANGLTSSNIRIGQKLTIPGKSFAPDPVTTASVTTTKPEVKQVTSAVKQPAKPASDSLTQTAQIKSDIIAPEKTGIGKLRWPAKGQIVTSFGGKNENGKRNDGIDILLPEGSPIKASENGVVIYADSGLKGFGNTVLVRHSDDLVTVYAHARSLNVKRGDKVTRGQVVAYSGMTGSADRPKLHFEVRQKAVPKNPISFLE